MIWQKFGLCLFKQAIHNSNAFVLYYQPCQVTAKCLIAPRSSKLVLWKWVIIIQQLGDETIAPFIFRFSAPLHLESNYSGKICFTMNFWTQTFFNHWCMWLASPRVGNHSNKILVLQMGFLLKRKFTFLAEIGIKHIPCWDVLERSSRPDSTDTGP